MANISTVSTPLGSPVAGARAERKAGRVHRLLDAIMESRQRKADAEIAEMIAWRRGAPLEGLDGTPRLSARR